MRGLHAAGSASSSILWLGAAAAATLLVQTATAAGSTGQSKLLPGHSRLRTSSLEDRPKECPPCFDCHLPRFNCLNSGKCNEYDGQCICQPGFGGLDCGIPLDGSLADGKERYPREGNHPTCKEGWSGLTCNVCETNKACKAMVPEDGDSTIRPGFAALVADNDKEQDTAVCYTGGFAVKEVHQMCDVTNRKILDMLPDRPPQVTFSCNRQDNTCGFQFWVGGIESFFCGLDECAVSGEATQSGNVTKYDCQKISCQCIPDRMLCGEAGSVNIDDFLAEEIKGPGTFSCKTDGSGCIFTEPAMNQLINDIFGDSYITLNCNSGECLHYSMVPGFEAPTPPNNAKLVAASIAVTGLAVLIACLAFWYLGRVRKHDFGSIRLPGDSNGHDPAEVDRLMNNHLSGSLSFEKLSYITPNGKQVLSDVSGNVQSGQLLAIMGASGAGKSTFLDILAKKTKRGSATGEILVNGRSMTRDKYRRIVGFVDQDDTLMPTLTVYETVLYSALLRLPRDMSLEAKKLRTLETMQELGILGIKDSRIGESGKRSISGGEKRRVSIACELVTSPSIIFLDEPTSGLDAFNAINVIECLVNLAKDYHRTVVFTIHQPRSNIVAMFDKLLLLAGGKAVYSGEYAKCQEYFEGIGHPCPPGFNIADFLIDLTMQDERTDTGTSVTPDDDVDEERGQGTVRSRASTFASDTELQNRKSSRASSLRQKLGLSSPQPGQVQPTRSPHLSHLIGAYDQSDIASSVKDFHEDAKSNPSDGGADLDKIASFKQASWWTQFRILSGRAFKNLYRNPMLMLAHYVVSIVVALLCSFLFANVTNDIPGFQNRMGLFFFILALFGFSCLTSLEVFAKERILFMRERSNGYYSPFTYFTAKVLFDVLPLRVIPPFILGAIVYHPVGLVPTVAQFWKFILVLIMFNMSASSIVFFLSIVISNSGVANLVGSLVMLFNLLFAGLLVNRDKVPLGVGWLQTISFFHAAFEGLLVNEVRYLQLKDHKYGVDIEVPAATILSMFGFRAQAFWWPDFAVLCIYFSGFMILSFIALVVLVKERR